MRLVLLTCVLAGCGRLLFDFIGPTPSIPSGPVVWLEMETDPNDTIIDSAGGHTVVCSTATCPTWTAGRHGKGYAFASQQLRIHASEVDLAGGFTAAAWVFLDRQPTDFACSFCKPVDTRDANSFCLCVDPSGNDYFFSGDPDGRSDTATGTRFPLRAWHHIAMTWDATTKIGHIDGLPVVSRANVPITFDQQDLVVGADLTPAPGYFWTGVIDDVVMYDRTLTPDEIRQLANP